MKLVSFAARLSQVERASRRRLTNRRLNRSMTTTSRNPTNRMNRHRRSCHHRPSNRCPMTRCRKCRSCSAGTTRNCSRLCSGNDAYAPMILSASFRRNSCTGTYASAVTSTFTPAGAKRIASSTVARSMLIVSLTTCLIAAASFFARTIRSRSTAGFVASVVGTVVFIK